VQSAATLATGSDNEIYLQWGVYSNASQIVISNAAGLNIYGGCNGGSEVNSNEYSGTNSTLTRTSGFYQPDRLRGGLHDHGRKRDIQRGYFAPVAGTTTKGAGLYLTNCESFFTNCVVSNNWIYMGSLYGYGAGICVSGGKNQPSPAARSFPTKIRTTDS